MDLLICCGDFQAIRNADDLAAMAVPDKYKQIGQFHRYGQVTQDLTLSTASGSSLTNTA